MATPTPGSASKRPGGGVSTPSHLNQSSPPPRSVPSPNAARHHPAGKTPVNHPTTSSSHGSKTVSSTPMVQNLSQSGNSASPGINALGTPGLGGLGIDGITPSALHNISTPLAFAMSRTDSEMRMSNIVAKRNEDEERRLKMRKVLKRIGRPKGRVSEEGIVRIARRVGMVNDIDDEKLTQEQRERKVGNRSFSVAGESVIVDIELKDHIPQSVEVNGDAPEPEEAARVLFRDLKEPGDVPLTASLDRFALNLSYLAGMDRLKKETDTDCFAAVGGVYRSLRMLYDKEHEVAAQQVGGERAAMDSMCKRSGKPIMHTRQKLGLCLDYWKQSKYPSRKTAPDESSMDLDQPIEDRQQHEKEGIWTLLVGAEKIDAAKMTYLPLRVSDRWLPDPLELPAEDSGESIKWLEPTDDHEGLFKAYFVATLDPPVALPYGVADAVLKNFNVQSVPDMQSIPSYVSLLLATDSGSRAPPPSTSGAFSSLKSMQEVISTRNGKLITVQHQYTLDNAKPDFGYLLRELPFSHPKQLIELMPTLRQWAGFGILLSQSLEASSTSMSGNDGTQDKKLPPLPKGEKTTTENVDQAPRQTNDFRTSMAVGMALSTTPQPSLNITFRTAAQEGTIANLDVHILPNAKVVIDINSGIEFDDDEAKSKAETQMAKALDVCWDLGVWIEWVRGQYS